MSISLHTIAPSKGARTKSFRVGRGNASGRGTTAGRGTKGQRARTGGRNRLKLKGLKQMLLAFPKLRGTKSLREKPATVPLDRVVKLFNAGEKVTLETLRAKGLVTKSARYAKIVGTADVGKALIFSDVAVTASAKAAVEKSGGSFAVAPKRTVKKTESKKK